MQLPEEAIKNWLIFKSEAKGNSAKGSRKMEERFLQIKMNGIENGSEMCSSLKEVNYLAYNQHIFDLLINNYLFYYYLFQPLKPGA